MILFLGRSTLLLYWIEIMFFFAADEGSSLVYRFTVNLVEVLSVVKDQETWKK